MATWVYDPATAIYRQPSGRKLSTAQLLDVRNAIADGMAEEAAALVRAYLAGSLTLTEWSTAFAALLTSGITAGYALGAGGLGALDRAMLTKIDTLIAAQMPYAKDFARALADMTPEQTASAEGRASLYAGSAIHAYEVGQSSAWGVDLPVYPTMDSPCGGNCRCYISITDDAENIYWSWITVGDDRVCETCQSRGDRYQFVSIAKAT